MAPAWPVMPPPLTVTLTSNVLVELHQLERLAHDHARRLAAEELVERAVVDRDVAAARAQEDAGGGGLAPAGAVVGANAMVAMSGP